MLVAGLLFVGLLLYFRVSLLPAYHIQQRYVHESEHIAQLVSQAYIGLNELSRSQAGVSVSEHVLKTLGIAKDITEALRSGGKIEYSHIGHIYQSSVEKVRSPEAIKTLMHTSRAIDEFIALVKIQSVRLLINKPGVHLAPYRRLTREIEGYTTRFESVIEFNLRRSQKNDALLVNGLIALFSVLFVGVLLLARHGRRHLKLINSQLSESIERNQAIVDTAVEGIFITDKHGIIQFANASTTALFGYAPDELIGNNISILVPGDHGSKHDGYIQEHMDGKPSRIMGSGREVRGLRRDGTEFPMHIGVGTSHINGELIFTGIVWDLSKEKETERQIVSSEKELSAILKHMQDTYYRVDLDGKLVRISPSVKEILGYEAEELLGTKLAELYVEPDGRDRFLQALQKSGGQVRNYEAQLLHKHGSGVWVSTNAQYVKDGSGVIVGIEGTTRDVSEKRYMEQALRESETKFRTLAESSSAGIFIYQGNRLVYVNPAEARLTGYNINELFSMDFWDLIHPDFLETAKEWAATEARGEDVPQNRELKLRTKDGRTIWVEYSGTLVMYDNQPAGMGTIIDITHLKEAEQQLHQAKEDLEQRVITRTRNLEDANRELQQEVEERHRAESALRDKALIIDQIHESVVSTDLNGNITSWNRGAERLFGYSAEEMIGQPINLVYPEEEQGLLLEEIIAPLQAKGEHTVEVRMLKKSREIFYGHLSLSLLYSDQQQPVGMIGYALDITQRKIAEEKIDQDYHEQSAINAILKSSLEMYTLDEQLGLALDQLLLTPRFENILNASIFLLEDPAANSDIAPRSDLTHGDSFARTMQTGKNLKGRTAAYRDKKKTGNSDTTRHLVAGKTMSVPVTSLGKLLAVLHLDYDSAESVLQLDQDFLRVIANILAGIIERENAQTSLAHALRDINMIMNTVQDIIIKIDMHGHLISWNKELEIVTGYLPDELQGATAEKFLSPKMLARTQQAMKEAAETGFAYAEASIRLQDGNEVPYQWILSVLKDDSGNVIGYTGAARDLSERLEAEAQRLRDTERQRDALVREVHHRVKNNLQGIVGLLRHYTVENPGTKDVLENTISQIHSMALMYGLQSKHAHDEVVLCDMVTAIAENAQSLTNAVVSISSCDIPSANLTISAKDNVSVALVLNELIFNAIKHHSGPGDRAVDLKICEADHSVDIIISNQGRLLPEFNWDTGTGLGTGLNLVKSLAPAQGTQIRIYNQDDRVVAELALSSPVLIGKSDSSDITSNNNRQTG